MYLDCVVDVRMFWGRAVRLPRVAQYMCVILQNGPITLKRSIPYPTIVLLGS